MHEASLARTSNAWGGAHRGPSGNHVGDGPRDRQPPAYPGHHRHRLRAPRSAAHAGAHAVAQGRSTLLLLDLQGSGPPLPLTDPAEVLFKHRHEDGNCPAITACSLSQEEIDARKYNGATESRLHRCMKGWLCKCPTQDGQVSDIVQEPTWKDALTRACHRWRASHRLRGATVHDPPERHRGTP